MNRYNVITTVDIEQQLMAPDGTITTIIIPAGSVINTVMWDGVAEWTPPEGCTVVLETQVNDEPVADSAPVVDSAPVKTRARAKK